jgi:hypothetical protein
VLLFSIVRTTCAATVLVALLSAPAHADPDVPDAPPAPPPTFRYTTPADTNPLRATLELGAVWTFGFAWYATTSTDIVHHWDVGYSWSAFEEKLTGQAFGPDTNQFGTNFVGHPLGGTGYYLAARSNRLGILQSFGYSIAGSILWELFGEVSEVLSMNDSLVTPVAGLAIGESTTQLGAFFDRSGPSSTNRVFGTVFGPFKSVNDVLDGLEPARAPRGFPDDEWHRFDLTLSARGVFEDSVSERWWPEVELGASSRLARFVGYEAPASDSQSFDDANVSSLELRAAFARPGLTDLLFAAQVVLAGIHFRQTTLDARGRAYGGNGFVGVATTFRYALHDYQRDEPGPLDKISSVSPVGVVFEQRGALGGARLVTRIDAAPDFAGVTPLAPGVVPRDSNELPVLEHHGYYFGVGGHLGATIELEDGPIELSAVMRGESYRAFAGPGERLVPGLSDVATQTNLRFAYRLHQSPVALLALGEHRGRTGKFGSARAQASEYAAGAGVGAVF